ncbi:unnamed protein product [Meloidogyne enterolobii]|uniref:Uncharacterized protein n=1 Tax=Meloidogyne enterolobii TaxID=390850 RepID=A0ACB0YPU7_MELEN
MIIFKITTNSQMIFITPTTGNLKGKEEIKIQLTKRCSAKKSETITIEWMNKIFGKQNLFASNGIVFTPQIQFSLKTFCPDLANWSIL